MGTVDRSAASIRFVGDDLDPDEITRLLGAEPSFAYRRGDTVRTPNGQSRIARYGLWRLNPADSEPANLDRQTLELLAVLTDDQSIWAELGCRFRVEMFVGLFSERINSGLGIAPETLRLLADRHISIDLDIYGPLQDSSED